MRRLLLWVLHKHRRVHILLGRRILSYNWWYTLCSPHFACVYTCVRVQSENETEIVWECQTAEQGGESVLSLSTEILELPKAATLLVTLSQEHSVSLVAVQHLVTKIT